MRLSWLLLLGCLSACASGVWPSLVSVSSWERGQGNDSAETRRIDVLHVPRNAELTLKVLAVRWPGNADERQDAPPQCVLRLHSMDGGTLTWRLTPSAGATAPTRAEWLTRLDVVVGFAPLVGGLRTEGPAALADVPVNGPFVPREWERLALAVDEAGGGLSLATQIPVRPGPDGPPGHSIRHVVLEGTRDDGAGGDALAIAVEFEVGIEIVDRSHRPEQREKRENGDDDDPVHKPRPRQLAAVR